MNTYLPAVATVALLYGALGLSLNLQVGRTGVINFGHVAFFGVGAYATALLSLHGVSLALSIPAAGVLGGLAALPLGWIAARLTSHYLAIVTIAFAETLRVLLQNLEATGGPSGLVGVPRPFGQLDPDVFAAAWLALAAGLLAGTWLLVRVVTRGLLGMGLSAIKEDERPRPCSDAASPPTRRRCWSGGRSWPPSRAPSTRTGSASSPPSSSIPG
ncbi:branched-chain amino acid ABC transporter permease [Actinomadura madurae]|nr:branched-chain amino acid ABC transporter permease [Actinomadura madurae]MCQ0018051.1 branched-chain amino acid ABC transporter permease [Actinomadura madurae]